VVLAPLTRQRAAEPSLAPTHLHVEYYAQRASPGGLVITEAVYISPEALAYPGAPGIWTAEQTERWKSVTAAVHAKGGKISIQLWHTGRIGHPSFGKHPLVAESGRPIPSVSSSAVPFTHPRTGKLMWTSTYEGKEEHVTPRALTRAGIQRVCKDYQDAARNAVEAGFDYVELHAAHGYLVDQFLQNGVNHRSDEYGGSVENRCRFLFEVVDALTDVVGRGRVAVRLSPTTFVNGRQNQLYFGATDTNPDAVYEHAVNGLNRHGLAYLLLTEPRWNGRDDDDVTKDKGIRKPLSNAHYRQIYKGTLMAGGGFTPASAKKAVADGTYDLIAFGRWFISNPDLPDKLRRGSPLNVYRRASFYEGGADGYVDYPSEDGLLGETGKYPLMEQDRVGASLLSAKL